VFLKDDNIHAHASEKKRKNHSGWAAPYNTAMCFYGSTDRWLAHMRIGGKKAGCK
jgi:hypothetical protein